MGIIRDYKIVRNDFHWLDATGMTDYLTKMADKGWQLERLDSVRLFFRSVQPGRICYTLDYVNGEKAESDWQRQVFIRNTSQLAGHS